MSESEYESFVQLLSHRRIELTEESRRNIWRYFRLLHARNQQFNLTGYQSMADYVDYHLADILAVLRLYDLPAGSLADIGSGAGVPGILLKILRPGLRVQLIDSSRKKVQFLREVIQQLSLEEIEVLEGRAESLAHDPDHRERYTYAMARALAALPQALELTAGFVAPEGVLLLPRGGDDLTPEHEERVLGLLGLEKQQEPLYALEGREKPYRLAVYRKVQNTPAQYPRKPVHIQKRPL